MSYALVDTAKQQLLWQCAPQEADWWSSLTAFSYDQFFLHNYRYPEIPEPTDLLAYNASDGQLLWVLPNYLMVKPQYTLSYNRSKATPNWTAWRLDHCVLCN